MRDTPEALLRKAMVAASRMAAYKRGSKQHTMAMRQLRYSANVLGTGLVGYVKQEYIEEALNYER